MVSRITEACSALDVQVSCGIRSTDEIQAIASRGDCDLIIMDSLPEHALKSGNDEQLHILFVIDPDDLETFRLPVQYLADFASTGKVAYAAASSDAGVAHRLTDSNGQSYTADDFATKVKTTSCAWSAYCDTMFSHPFALSQKRECYF